MPETGARISALYAAFAAGPSGFESRRLEALVLDPGGIPRERHHGLFRAAGPRSPSRMRGLTWSSPS
jgi:hypothetical protein